MPAVAPAWSPYDLRALPVGLQAELVKSFWHAGFEAYSSHNCRPQVKACIYPTVYFFANRAVTGSD